MTCGARNPCHTEALQNAIETGTQIADKDRAKPDTHSGSEGGAQVRTLSYSRDREKIQELLALVEQGPSEAMDPVGQFLAEHGLEPGFTPGVALADLYRMYEDWCRGVDAVAPKVFVRRVQGFGFRRSPFMAPGKPSYAVLMGQEGARVCLMWLLGHPAEFGYGKKFRQRMLRGGK